MRLRKMTAITTGLIVLAALILAGCSRDNSDKKPAPPPTPTMPAVITRIVTPGPTRTPLPTPTLAYDIAAAEGRWLMRFEMAITKGSFAEVIAYTGFADLQVSLDGTIQGTGHFSQSIDNPPCDASVQDSEGIDFSVTGTTFPQGDAVMAQIDLVPDDPTQNENYLLLCPDYQDIRHFQQPLLWPGLTALQRRDLGSGATVEGLRWTFALMNTPLLHFESNLVTETSGLVTGYLTGDVSIIRG